MGPLYVLRQDAASSLALETKCRPSGMRPEDTYYQGVPWVSVVLQILSKDFLEVFSQCQSFDPQSISVCLRPALEACSK